jgi:hypothetical protein
MFPHVPNRGCSPIGTPGAISYYPVSASNLEPTPPADYLAIQSFIAFENSVRIVSEWGTKCDGAECQVQLYEPTKRPCEHGACDALFARRGATVERMPLSRAGALLVPIDTPAEALLIVRAMGYDVTCTDVSESDDGDYLVLGRKDNGVPFFESYCMYMPILVQEIFVSKDGSTRRGVTTSSRRSTGCA